MIPREEIESKAKEFEIHVANVQRDYVFGWLLFGLFTGTGLSSKIFLKGGNALRKGYFENTRFSSDLDFGTPGDIDQATLLEEFRKACALIEVQAGVHFLQDEHRIKEKFVAGDSATPDLKVYEVRLYFKDFYDESDHIRIRVSVDFTRYDKVLLPIQEVPLIHPYSDSVAVKCTIRCMKIEEIIATKLKCILQRQHAPDLFDYVYTVKQLGGNLDRNQLVKTFIRKTIFDRNPHVAKKILLSTPFQFFRDYWAKGVVCAKQVLIGVDDAIEAFTTDLVELFKVYPESTFAAFAYFPAEKRLPIMQAARTMTCLRITYDGFERIVEPYSLRYLQRRDGAEREYFYVYDRVGGRSGQPGIKALVADKLTSILNTEEKFEPRFAVELSKAGEVPKDRLLFDPNKPAKPERRTRSAYGESPIRYVYRCSICGKEFKRREMDSMLNPHKNKRSYDCPGRYGIYVTTKWS